MRFAPIPGHVRVGWRNLLDGAFRRVQKNPGHGWCPVYVREHPGWAYLPTISEARGE